MIMKLKQNLFYNNVINNNDVISKNDVTLSVTNDHSMINYKVSQNYIDESLKSMKDKEI